MKKHNRTNILPLLCTIAVIVLLSACSVEKYVPEGEYYLKDIKVTSDNSYTKTVIKNYSLKDYNHQQLNTKWFGAKVPLKFYTLSGTDKKNWLSRWIRKIGEEPVLYDSLYAKASSEEMLHVLENAGFIHSSVDVRPNKKGKKVILNYDVTLGERYFINDINYDVADPFIDSIMSTPAVREKALIESGEPLDINSLNAERSRITEYLRNNGFYKFTKEDIEYVVDTIANSTMSDVTIRIRLHQDNKKSQPELHHRYAIGDIAFLPETDGKIHFRKSFLSSHTLLRPGHLYNDSDVKNTYTNFSRLAGVLFTTIKVKERESTVMIDSANTDTHPTDTLDAEVTVTHTKPYSIGFDVDATNSAGDLGAAVSAIYTRRNIFRGCENFDIKVRGAYEAITGLEGYDGHNYFEIGVEGKLTFPTFLCPFVKKTWAVRHNATSEISLQYNLQNRPEFQRRVLTGVWRYRWNNQRKNILHKFDLLEVNYVYMPWISQTFKQQYLDSIGKTNAILKYNYENILITKLGYTYTFNSLGSSQQIFGKNAWTLKFNVESSGNLLYGLTTAVHGKQNSLGQYTFCSIAYAQYVRGDFDFAKSWRIDRNNSLAFHAAFGIAFPYGNSTMLPFEKRYFGGGPNSVRGWAVRSLGPGCYSGADHAINFLNQSGDIKLDLSLEYRANLFWKISGAAFIDAGNIWTIKSYADQPGGEFRFDRFYDQIAVSYGIGLRMNLSFFILRFDAGMKAINPAYTGRDHYPIYHPNFKRDFAFHFAVGMPF